MPRCNFSDFESPSFPTFFENQYFVKNIRENQETKYLSKKAKTRWLSSTDPGLPFV